MRKEELIDKDTALRLCEEIKELAVSAFESISESENVFDNGIMRDKNF